MARSRNRNSGLGCLDRETSCRDSSGQYRVPSGPFDIDRLSNSGADQFPPDAPFFDVGIEVVLQSYNGEKYLVGRSNEDPATPASAARLSRGLVRFSGCSSLPYRCKSI